MRVSIPIENYVRELLPKLFLSLKLVECGHHVYIGRAANVGHDIIQPDVFLSNYNQSDFAKSDRINAEMMLLDAEGGLFQASTEDYRRRITSIEGIDHYLAWNRQTAEIVNEAHDSTEVSITGNPRFDLTQHPFREVYVREGGRLKNEYGKFVLINTNFSGVNNLNRDDPPENHYLWDSARFEHRKYVFLSFIEMISSLGKATDKTIIIRPHPGENFATYEEEFSDMNNIQVIHEGDVRNWICGSHVVVHNGSTTGAEAALMNKKVYAYVPDSHTSEGLTSNQISIQKAESDSLVRTVCHDLNRADLYYAMSSEQLQLLKRHIDNLDYTATDKIVDIVDTADLVDAQTTYRPSLRERAKRFTLRVFGPTALYRIRASGLRAKWPLFNQKFPHVSDEKIKEDINRFSDWIDTSNIRFERVDRLDSTFHLYP